MPAVSSTAMAASTPTADTKGEGEMNIVREQKEFKQSGLASAPASVGGRRAVPEPHDAADKLVFRTPLSSPKAATALPSPKFGLDKKEPQIASSIEGAAGQDASKLLLHDVGLRVLNATLREFIRDEPANANGNASASGVPQDGRHLVTQPSANQFAVTGQESFYSLMERAKELEIEGSNKLAAQFYLYCVDKFKHSSAHELLAECLRRLANLCERNQRYEEAVRFRHAEKMVYETRLLAATLQEARAQQMRDTTIPASMLTGLIDGEEIAIAWERMAKAFFEKGDLELAKSYALKAIELRRETAASRQRIQSLNSAELPEATPQMVEQGRVQYEEALRKVLGHPLSVPSAAASAPQLPQGEAPARTPKAKVASESKRSDAATVTALTNTSEAKVADNNSDIPLSGGANIDTDTESDVASPAEAVAHEQSSGLASSISKWAILSLLVAVLAILGQISYTYVSRRRLF